MNEETAWRTRLLVSLSAVADPTARYVQFATVTPKGRPANRTVVFRGFIDDSTCLTFVTDGRSRKVSDLTASTNAAVCWYLAECREQYRFRGPVQIIESGHADAQLVEAREAAWRQLSDKVRKQFFWPEPASLREPAASLQSTPPPLDEPPASFCLLVLDPERVEHLDLRHWPHRRTFFRRTDAGEWEVQEVNP